MKLVQRGRLITFTSSKLHNKLAVILEVQDAKHVIIQHILTMQRERVNLNQIRLLDTVIELVEGSNALDVQRVVDQQAVVKSYESSEEYQRWEKNDRYLKMNDFERFMHGVKERIETEVLQEKKLI